MLYKVRRDNNENNGVIVTPETNEWLAIVCDNITQTDHEMVKEDIEQELNLICDIDLYYTRNLISIFIFDMKSLAGESAESVRETIKSIITDINHNTVYHNTVYGKRLTGLAVTTSKTEFKVSKKYQVLLTIQHV